MIPRESKIKTPAQFLKAITKPNFGGKLMRFSVGGGWVASVFHEGMAYDELDNCFTTPEAAIEDCIARCPPRILKMLEG